VFTDEMLTELMDSWRSNTTRASMCQYIDLWNPLCSNHIRPGYGQGIFPLSNKQC